MAAAQFTFHVNSRQTSSRSKSNTRGKGMFCSVCKAAGKSVEEYTSHFVRENRDPNSRVVCPVLLATVCRYCKATGHTKNHCPILKRRNEQRSLKCYEVKDSGIVSRHERKPLTVGEVAKQNLPAVPSRENAKWMEKHSLDTKKTRLETTQSRFAALDSDDESEMATVVTQEFPSLGMASAARTEPLPYGKMINRAPVKEVAAPIEEKKSVKQVTFELPKIEKSNPVKEVTFDFVNDFADWADEVEESQDTYQLETPEWAKSHEEKGLTRQEEIQSSVAQLQYELCDGWE